MDVVALFQHGVDAAVATLGTATTPDHAELLFRNAPDVYFCFDGDRAGRGAAWKARGVGTAAHEGRPPGVLPVPARWRGPGFASCARKAATASTRACSEATPLSQFFFDSLSSDVNLDTLEGKRPPGRTRQAAAGADPRRRLRRPDEAAPDRADRRRRARQQPGVDRAASARSARARGARKPSWCAARSRCCCSNRRSRWRCRRRCISPRSTSPASVCWWSCSNWCTSARTSPPALILEHFADRSESAGADETGDRACGRDHRRRRWMHASRRRRQAPAGVPRRDRAAGGAGDPAAHRGAAVARDGRARRCREARAARAAERCAASTGRGAGSRAAELAGVPIA